MTALLLIFVFSVGSGNGSGAATQTQDVQFPTMAGCQAAAERIAGSRGPHNSTFGAFCVDYR
jgi:hypothetical protein